MDPFVMFVSRALYEERIVEAARRHRWDDQPHDQPRGRWSRRLAWLIALPILRAR
jgi:hypothetical protein